MFKLCLILLFLFNYYHDFQSVDGASCTTHRSCQATDYTLEMCLLNSCLCINSSFTPIRTGCGLKLDKPVIYADSGHSNQVVISETFSLVCKVFEAATFEWYLDTSRLACDSEIYTATANASSVGWFSCRGITNDGAIKSELSELFHVQMLGGSDGLSSSSVQPEVVVPTQQIVSGGSIRLSCSNIPMGYKGSFNYTVNGTTIINPNVLVDSSNAGTEVRCTIADTANYHFLIPTSAPARLPTLITNIQSVAVTLAGLMVKELGKTSALTYYTLTCTLTPDYSYLGRYASVTYSWSESNNLISSETSNTYRASDSGEYSCTATLSGQSAVMSRNTVKVTNYDTILLSSTNTPIRGGRVILICGKLVINNNLQYHWMKDSLFIGRQYDRMLQIDNFDSSDDGVYQCYVESTYELYQSNSITLKTQTNLDKPRLNDAQCVSYYGIKGDYRLVCLSDSETIGMTYEWTVNGVVSPVKSKYYNLPSITSANNGVYVCRAKFDTLTSPDSDPKVVAVSEPGLICYHDYTCIAAKTGYTGTCGKNERCKCSFGYSRKGERCSSRSDGILAAASSTVIIAVAYFVSRVL